MEDLKLTIVEPMAPHTHTVVFLHGRGDNAVDFADSLHYSTDSHKRTLQENFPSFRWVFPSSKIRPCAAFPGDRVSQWFDIWNVQDFTQREELQAVGLRESVAGVRRVLEGEARRLGGRWDRIVLAGISQGAATSTHTLLNLDIPAAPASAITSGTGPNGAAPQPSPRRLGAYLGFSCRMPFPGRSLAETRGILHLDNAPQDAEVLRSTPILLEHCADDPLVRVESGRQLRDSLRGFGASVAWREYSKGEHWFKSPEGIDDAVAFLKEALGEQSIGQVGQVGGHEMDLS